MSHQAVASLPTLPMEILHRIFNELDGTTLFLSVRDVCRSFRAAVDTHHRYALDCAPLSKPDFHQLVRVIRPEFTIALTLSDGERTPG